MFTENYVSGCKKICNSKRRKEKEKSLWNIRQKMSGQFTQWHMFTTKQPSKSLKNLKNII